MKTFGALAAVLALAVATALGIRFVVTERGPGAAAGPAPAAEPPALRWLAGHAVTWALGAALAEGTGIDVGPAWPAGLEWSEQAEYARTAGEAWAAVGRGAAAALTLRTVARDEALWPAVRAVAPRCVELDVAVAADQRTPVVARSGGGEGEGPGAALGPMAATRIAERMAEELGRWRPERSETIAENLRRTKERLFRLRAEGERGLARAAAPEVAVFSPEFDALLAEAGVQIVVRAELPPENAPENVWQQLAETLRAGGAGAAVVGREPSPRLAAALAAAGMKAAKLDPLRRAPGTAEDYFRATGANFAALAAALAPAAP